MARSTAYHFLLCSLPHLFSLSGTAELPISRLRLQDRLRCLQPADAATLKAMEDLWLWHRSPVDTPDEQVVGRAEELLRRLRSETLRSIVAWQLQERTLVAALRLRARDQGLPRNGRRWGDGPLARYLERNFQRPTFGLEPIHPWLPEAQRLVEARDALGLERLRLRRGWDFLRRTAEGHYFDFEAVVLYVLRWHLLDARLRFDGEAALERFDALLVEGTTGVLDTPEIRRALA